MRNNIRCWNIRYWKVSGRYNYYAIDEILEDGSLVECIIAGLKKKDAEDIVYYHNRAIDLLKELIK